MNYEQLAYLETLVRNANVAATDSCATPSELKSIFDEFVARPELIRILDDFERRVKQEWNSLISAKLFPNASRPIRDHAGVQYKRVEFNDFSVPSSNEAQDVSTRMSFKRPEIPGQFKKVVAASLKRPASMPTSLTATNHADALPAALMPPPAPSPLPSASRDSMVAAGTPATFTASADTLGPANTEASRKMIPRPALRFSVSNACQEKSYWGDIQCDPKVDGLRLLDLRLPDNSGLAVDTSKWRIEGTPSISGEFNLGLRYAFVDDQPEASHTGKLPLVINADPKTLWKNIPSESSQMFWKADTDNAFCKSSEARIVAARKRGASHAHKGTCCDDDVFVFCDEAKGWHLAVVADGAGSRTFSRRGSEIVTREVGAYMSEVFTNSNGQVLVDTIEAWMKAIDSKVSEEDMALAQNTVRNQLFTTLGYSAHNAVRRLLTEVKDHANLIATPGELATTLLIGIARKVGTRWFCAAYWVGDGAIAVYRRGQEVQLLGTPDSGEFSGQTRFLDPNEVTQEALLRRLKFTVVEDMTAFLLMTDGVSDPKFKSEAQLARVEAWDLLWEDLDGFVKLTDSAEGVEQRLLEWLDFRVAGEYDDRTIAIIC